MSIGPPVLYAGAGGHGRPQCGEVVAQLIAGLPVAFECAPGLPARHH